MTTMLKYSIVTLFLGGFLFVVTVFPANAAVSVQCPGDIDGDALWNSVGEPDLSDPAYKPGITKCLLKYILFFGKHHTEIRDFDAECCPGIV